MALTLLMSCSCRHTDFVTALDFHPADDKFFLSGSIDGKVNIRAKGHMSLLLYSKSSL